MVAVSRAALVTAVMDRLDDQVTHPGYLGEPGEPVPTKTGTQRVAPHWILYPRGGTPDVEVDLAETAEDLLWGFQLTVVSGDAEDIPTLVDLIHATFHRWTPAVPGVVCGAFHPPEGYDPGPLRRDTAVTPHRFWAPLQFESTFTTT